MSELTKFYTFAQMENAVIVNSLSTSFVSGFQLEHAVNPLEPNFYWELDNISSDQPEIVIDLGSIEVCNCFVGIAKEELGTWWEVEVADEAVTGSFITVDLEQHDAAALSPTTELIKAYHFTDGDIAGRYWRIKTKGSVASNYYAVTDVKIAVNWVGTVHKLDRGGSYPLQDTESFLTQELYMTNGQVFSTGLNVNSVTTMERTYRVNDTEYDLLRAVIAECNGSYRPFVLHEVSVEDRLLCHFTDILDEQYIEVGIRLVTIKFQSVPIVATEKYH